MKSIYGYFSEAHQEEPTYDPGLDVDCPICHQRLSRPMKTISLMLEHDDRSYFYRVHKACYDALTPDEQSVYDSVIIDAVGRAKRDVN
jgi:hypothetical protein